MLFRSGAVSSDGGAAMGEHAVLEVREKPVLPKPGTTVHTGTPVGTTSRMIDCITAPLYAAIDLGSSNCRLLVARPCNDGFKVIDAFSRVVRLGEGVREKGYLCEAAMDRAIDALRVCAKKLRKHPGASLRAVATEACRSANNRDDFIQRVRDETGISLDIINPDEESRLALQACSALLDERPYAVVFDIGGGSTLIQQIGRASCRERV